ncbi:hypothetical protein AUP68_11352 [Ilyonectria robusta]
MNYNYLIPEIPGVLENQSPSVAPSCAIPICPSDSQNPSGLTGPGSLVPEDPEGLPGWSTGEYGIHDLAPSNDMFRSCRYIRIKGWTIGWADGVERTGAAAV